MIFLLVVTKIFLIGVYVLLCNSSIEAIIEINKKVTAIETWPRFSDNFVEVKMGEASYKVWKEYRF